MMKIQGNNWGWRHARWLRTLTAFTEDQDLVPSILRAVHNHDPYFQFQGI